MVDEEALFFTSLGSVSSVSDHLLRRLWGLLMVVSLDFTKLELLEDLSSTKSMKKQKPKPKPVSGKKGKLRDVKNKIPVQRSISNSTSDKPAKGICQVAGDVLYIQESDLKTESASTSVETAEHADGLINGTVQSTSKKNKRVRKKHKDGISNQVKNIITPTGLTKPHSLTNDHKSVSEIPDPKIYPDGTSVVDYPVEAKDVLPAIVPIAENGHIIESQNVNFNDREHVKEMDAQSLVTSKEKREQKPVFIHDGGPVSFSGNPSYEWPGVSPQLSFVSRHLPATTDILHLDVGHNWQNHFHQSGFLHTVNHWVGEDDFSVSGMDYSQYFGGSVMYWDSSDHPVASATFSRTIAN